MSNKEKKETIEFLLKDQDIFTVKDVMDANHKPHPYVIGPKHVAWASNNHNGMLSDESIIEGEKKGKVNCAHPSCNTRFEDHTSDNILFLQLKRNCSKEEATKILASLKLDESKLVDGIAFVETNEKFRII